MDACQRPESRGHAYIERRHNESYRENREEPRRATVYNFEVKDFNLYFVSNLELVTLLVNGEYDLIVSNGENGRLTQEEIIFAIEDYGGKLSFPTEDDFESANIIQVGSSSEYVVEYELWFDNQKSDLTLSATVNTQEGSIAIDNIHVM